MNDEYAAGLIDGEGYIGIQQTGGSFQVRLKVSMTDKGLPALHALRKLYGGRVEPDKGQTATTRASHTWRLTGESATAVIKRLRPLFLVKGEAADIALEFDAMLTASPKRPNRGRYWTDEMRDRAESEEVDECICALYKVCSGFPLSHELSCASGAGENHLAYGKRRLQAVTRVDVPD